MELVIKICGLSTPDALDAAMDMGADLVGFVFFPPSPRHLDLPSARALGRRAADRTGKVAVTVDADDALLAATVEALEPDMLQLHGREPPERITAIKSRFGIPAMKALPVARAADLATVALYAGTADWLLFDTRPPRNATRPGGLGLSFDWRLLDVIKPSLPFMLSGGLNAGNVATALAVTRADAVDVSSGIERAPGVKDPEMIQLFIREARRVDAARRRSGGEASARGAPGISIGISQIGARS